MRYSAPVPFVHHLRPAEYRVNGIVRNVDAWYAAFDVKPGDTMYLPPDQRVHIG